MGHYTRVRFSTALRSDMPSDVVELLSAVAVNDWDHAEEIVPQHEFFKADYWQPLLRGTYAAPSWPEADGKLTFDRNVDGSYRLSFHSSTKNYGHEIDKFLAWIGPYVASPPGEVLGEYEGEPEYPPDPPTLLVAQVGRVDKLDLPSKTSDDNWY